MNIFRTKNNSLPPASQAEDTSEQNLQVPQEQAAAPIGLGDMPPEIGAAIFAAIDIRTPQGVDAFDALRGVSQNFRAVGNDMLLRAINPANEAADMDMDALREQMESVWLPEDETKHLDVAMRHLRDAAKSSDESRRKRHHKTMPIARHVDAIVSSTFSPSGRLMALGDDEGNVSVTDMQAVLHAADNPSPDAAQRFGDDVLHLFGSALALSFSGDDKALAVAHQKPEAPDTAEGETAMSAWYIAVHDLTRAEMPLSHYVALPAQLDDISSVALDARGQNLVIASEGRDVVYHAVLHPPTEGQTLGSVTTKPVTLPHRCDGEVAYTSRGTLMYGRRGGLQSGFAPLQGTALDGGSRRPFVMPRTSQIDRRALSMQPMDHRRTYVAASESDDGGFNLHLNKHSADAGHNFQVLSERVAWKSAQTPSVLFAPGRRHVLLTSDSGRAELLDIAPPPSRQAHLRAMREKADVAPPQAAQKPSAQRRKPIKPALPGKQTIRHALNRLSHRR